QFQVLRVRGQRPPDVGHPVDLLRLLDVLEHLLHQTVRVVFRDELDGRHGRAPFFTLDVRPRSPPRARGQTKSASTCGAARTDLVLFRHTPHVNPGQPAHGARAPGTPRGTRPVR